jgi:hypothetical protein
MRQERTVQASIFGLFATHEIGCELKAMSQWLDEHCDLLGLVVRDLVRVGVATSLPSIARLKSARSQCAPATCSRVRMVQTSRGLRGGFWPTM